MAENKKIAIKKMSNLYSGNMKVSFKIATFLGVRCT